MNASLTSDASVVDAMLTELDAAVARAAVDAGEESAESVGHAQPSVREWMDEKRRVAMRLRARLQRLVGKLRVPGALAGFEVREVSARSGGGVDVSCVATRPGCIAARVSFIPSAGDRVTLAFESPRPDVVPTEVDTAFAASVRRALGIDQQIKSAEPLDM